MKKVIAVLLVLVLGLGIYAKEFAPSNECSDGGIETMEVDFEECFNIEAYEMVIKPSIVNGKARDKSIPVINFHYGKKQLKGTFEGSVYATYNNIKEIESGDDYVVISLGEPVLKVADLDVTYDAESEKSYFNDFTDDDYTELNKIANEEFKQYAIDNGIYELAEENARKEITTHIQQISGEDFDVRFE